MSLTNWWYEKHPEHKTRKEKEGVFWLFWACPWYVRPFILFFALIVLLAMGVIGFALGYMGAVLIFTYFGQNFPLIGILGPCRVWSALAYFFLSLSCMTLMIRASEYLERIDQSDRKNESINLARFMENWLTRVLWISITWVVGFFGKFRPEMHIIIFIVSLGAFLMKV